MALPVVGKPPCDAPVTSTALGAASVTALAPSPPEPPRVPPKRNAWPVALNRAINTSLFRGGYAVKAVVVGKLVDLEALNRWMRDFLAVSRVALVDQR